VALRHDIARSQKIPPSFVSKVLQSLVKAGLLTSSRGAGGGYSLARPATEIDLLQVVEALEGPLALVDCYPDSSRCEHAPFCPAESVWALVQRRMAETLREAKLEDLIAQPTRPRSG
jgi:Rrf2 family protein